MGTVPGSGSSASDDLRIIEAESLLEPLRGIPPQHATNETVDGYRQAASVLAHLPGSRLWFEAQCGLGSYLLESPHGESHQHRVGTRRFRAMLEHITAETPHYEWAGTSSPGRRHGPRLT